MRRREFISILGGAVVCWPVSTRPQQPERIRRIVLLMNFAESAKVGQTRKEAFLDGPAAAGLDRTQYRWGGSNSDA
jgi:putative tryptophan/tyrosine transport system substrate-binding protein